MRALLALGEPLDIVALGGPGPASIPPGIGYVAEPMHPPTNLGWTLVGLPRAARRGGVDVIHAPAYTAPWRAPAPVVLTIHDVSYERQPQWYPYRRDWARRAFYRQSALRADHILTVSGFSASEITAAYGIGADRISVTPLGVGEMFSPGAVGDSRDLPSPVTVPYLLHVGDVHERRNLPMIVEALAGVRQSIGMAPGLVLIGEDRGGLARVRAAAAAAGVPETVVHLARVTEQQLVDLYRGATAFVYPSLYEGFGLPLIEAMASGTPVLASTAASIPEVVGSAGLLLDPQDTSAWTEAIAGVAQDGGRCARMRQAGLARAADFTWRRTALLTLEAYRRVA